VNLVFAKPVYSYTKFWQMIGRGTRLLETKKPKPWCVRKEHFLVMDCWDNFEYFKLNPKGKSLSAQIPLPVRLVGLRLDKIEKAIDTGRHDIADREIAKLQGQILSLPAGSVVIKEAAAVLAQLDEAGFWESPTHAKIEFLRNEIQPLFRTVSEVDFKAMRFERDLLEFSLAKLSREDARAEILKEGIVAQIAELPLSVGFVKQEEEQIRAAQGAHFWSTADEDAYDDLVERLGPLMKFRETEAGTGTMHLNLTDLVKNKEMVEFGPQNEAVSIVRYREMVEALIAELTESTPLLRKLKEGGTISEDEATELAELLHAEHPHITEELLRKVYQNRKAHFLQFIRHILGIEPLHSFPETVQVAFDQFLHSHSDLDSRQLEFLSLLKKVLIERETLEKKDLIHAPFTVIHPQGIRGVFTPAVIEEILAFTEKLAA
jgi:type I restriction enzyme R subunit